MVLFADFVGASFSDDAISKLILIASGPELCFSFNYDIKDSY
jgi:hypothetical protein